MNLNLVDIVLAIIAEEGGSIKGKTLLQKKAYFLGLMLGENFGHRPHYYGPYSPAVESALGDLRGLGFVEERCLGLGMIDQYGFEGKRYDYILTEDGKKVANRVKQRNRSDYEKIKKIMDKLKDAGDPDSSTLSIAAKVMHILNKKDKSLSGNEIIKEARRFDWKIPDSVLKDAVNFLENMELVSTSQS